MSIESQPDPIPSDFYQDFSDTQIDPFIRGILAKIQAHNDLIKGEHLSADEINEIMNELDNEWKELLHTTARVTGIATFKPPKIGYEETDTVVDFFNDLEVEFGGVMPIQGETYTVYAGNDDGTDQTTHEFMLGLRLVLPGRTEDGAVRNIEGVAALEDITTITFADMMSVDGARTWLSYYHENDIADLDADLLRDPHDECSTLLRLAEHVVDITSPHKGDEWLSHRSRKALDIYTNSRIAFDDAVPYVLSCDGFAWDLMPDGSKEVAYAYGKKMMAKMHEVVWYARSERSDESLVAHVMLEFLDEHMDMPSRHMLVPVDAFKELRSFRREYFQDDANDTTGK